MNTYAQEEAERDVLNYPELEQEVGEKEKQEFEDNERSSKRSTEEKSKKLSLKDMSDIDSEEENRRSKVSSGIESRHSELSSEKGKLRSDLGGSPKELLKKAKENSAATKAAKGDDDFSKYDAFSASEEEKELRAKLKKQVPVGSTKMSIADRINNLEKLPPREKLYTPGKVDLGKARQRMAANTQMKNKAEIDDLLKRFSEGKETGHERVQYQDTVSSIMMELLSLPGKKKLVHAEISNKSWETSKPSKKMKLIPDFQKQTKPSTKKKKAKKS